MVPVVLHVRPVAEVDGVRCVDEVPVAEEPEPVPRGTPVEVSVHEGTLCPTGSDSRPGRCPDTRGPVREGTGSDTT